MGDPFATLREALAGRYDLGEEIGRGGMSVVFRAHDLRRRRDVAIKVLMPELSATLARDRFLREIKVQTSLVHPHVVPVHESGDAAGHIFFVLTLVEGESLRERIKREGPLPLGDALSIFRDVADALGYSHGRGIVHRDIKPGNILLTGHGALVTDFGIARVIDAMGTTVLTESGVALGTPTYMSPEQADESRNVDARSDIYSLGCVLFEMLAGEPPFSGKTAQAVIARHMMEKVPTLSLVRPGVPPAVEQAIERALAKVPADRFSDTADFVTALSTPLKPSSPRPRALRVGIAMFLASLLGLAWMIRDSVSMPLDSARIVVFPLAEIGINEEGGLLGETIALAIGSALEATDPLRWEDGYTWLSLAQRTDIRSLTAGEAEQITRARGARYRIEGDVVRRADSLSVILRLHDLETGRIERHTEFAEYASEAAVQAGLRAAVALLPALLEQGRSYDLPELLDREAAGVALWMLGNRAYRGSRFDEALSLYERALNADSRLAMAALRAAQAASWREDLEAAGRLVEHALRDTTALPSRFVDFGHGLRHYLEGSADSAIVRLHAALAADSLWEDAWMALGEVHRHLLPSGQDGAGAALDAFRRAREADPDFSPPLYHIAEISGWRGEETSRDAIEALQVLGSSETNVRIVDLVVRCAEGGMSFDDWVDATHVDVMAVFEAASSLALSGRRMGCAERAYEALLKVEDLDEHVAFGRYDSGVGLQSVLIAQGHADSASAVIESAVRSGIGFTAGLWVIDAISGAPTDAQAELFLEQQFGALDEVPYEGLGGAALWLLGQWESHRGNADRLARIEEELQAKAADGSREARLWRDGVRAHRLLASGDSLEALAQFEALRPSASRVDLLWSFWEPLAEVRIAQAELLLTLDRPAEALAVAAEIDNPGAIVNLIYLPRSLEVRIAASKRLGDVEMTEHFESRLSRLRDGTDRGR